MFKRILVPIDGSAHSTKAAEMAIDLARTFKAELILLHVARKYDLPDQLKDYIKTEHLTAHDMLAIDEATKRVKLLAVHPGVTIETIRENSSFEILMPEKVETTEPPTEEEQRQLREIDPTGMVIGK